MWAHVKKAKMHHLLTQYKIVTHKIQENVQHGITAATSQVAEGLPGHHLRKGLVKELKDL